MRNFLFSAAMLLSVWCMGQTVNGTVQSRKGEALIGAGIVALETKAGTTTDFNGKFSLSLSKGGNYTLKISYLGYQSLTVKVDLQNGQPRDLGILIMEPEQLELEQVNVSGTRVKQNAPVAYQNFDEETIEANNTGQDIPFLLNQATSLVTTSDAGAGVGYTGMRIRGSDQTRINVTINGIPVNDAESHGVFWVNTPDLGSSLNSIQIQRGVGSSTNGSGAFGANINLQTNLLSKNPFAKMRLGYGSFDTERITLELGSGLINKHWAFQGRLSQIKSDGYVDRARSNLRSYFMSGGYLSDKFSLKAVVFGGNEETYQAWYGLDSATYYSNRTYNYAGEKYNEAGELDGYYNDQVDNYSQNHYQLHYNQVVNSNLQLNVSGHYTKGSGYYEEYVNSDSLGTYGIFGTPVAFDDVVRRLWLDNDFYGLIYNLDYSGDKLNLIIGGGANRYQGIHFGELLWARYAGRSEPGSRFYFSEGDKNDINVYAKAYYNLSSKLQAFIDLQYRKVSLSGDGDDELGRNILFNDDFDFFNPKFGATYNINKNMAVYASYGIANREPSRQDYIENDEKPRAERLYDLEAGGRFILGKLKVNVNYFLMQYKDQLVLTGQLNNVGYPIRSNVGESIRTGVEIESEISLWANLKWMPNMTISTHQNIDYVGFDLVNYGKTPIAYSPQLIGGSVLTFTGIKNLEISLQNKYVGEQYLDNTGNKRYLLPDYFISDIRFAYALPVKSMKQLSLELSVFNFTNEQYASNGYVYGSPYYYAQAGINFMGGIRVEL